MASLLIRQIDEKVKTSLRVRAAENGRSMEEEAREILRAGLVSKPPVRPNLVESIRRHITPLGGVELKIPPRELVRPRVDFSE
jgi:plasmid stability protein